MLTFIDLTPEMDFPELTGTQKSKDGKATINLYAQADGGLV